MHAGCRDPLLDRDGFVHGHDDRAALVRELRACGATDALAGRRHTLTGKSRFAAAAAAYEHERRDGRLPATWEVISAHAWAPQPGAPIRAGGFDVTSIPVSNIPIRRRCPPRHRHTRFSSARPPPRHFSTRRASPFELRAEPA